MSLSFLGDREFFRAMLAIAVPVAFQQLITAGLNMIDVLMVGQLGESSVAPLGLANQIFFLLILFLFGVTSGMSSFTAQFWGKGDIRHIQHVLGICLTIAISVAMFFTLAATLIPERLMSFYTEDAEVIKLGSDYLRIVGLSYIFTAISVSYISVLRSITQVTLTVIVAVLALALKTVLAYFFIFGIAGLPALGVRRSSGYMHRMGIRMYLAFGPGVCLENAARPRLLFRCFILNVHSWSGCCAHHARSYQ